MRRIFILKFILVLSSNLFGQETKLMTRTSAQIRKAKEAKEKKGTIIISSGRDFTEEFYVLKSDENIRHGTYVKYRETFSGIQILESGAFQNGQQNGVWEFYHDFPTKNTKNSIQEKGHFVNGRKNGIWTSYYLDTIPEIINQKDFGNKRKTDSINISIDQQAARVKMVGMYLNDKRIGEWTSFTHSGDIFQKFNFSKNILIRDPSIVDSSCYNTNRRPLFIGGLPCLIDFLTMQFNFHGVIMPEITDKTTTVIVSFTVDKNGNVLAPTVESSTGNKAYENESLRVVTLTNGKWIPAISEGKSTDSIYKIKFSVIEKRMSRITKVFKLDFEPIF